MHACMHARFYLYVHRYLNKTHTWNFLIFKPFSKLFAFYHLSWNCLELISFFLCKEVLFPASYTLQHFLKLSWNSLASLCFEEWKWQHFFLKHVAFSNFCCFFERCCFFQVHRASVLEACCFFETFYRERVRNWCAGVLTLCFKLCCFFTLCIDCTHF